MANQSVDYYEVLQISVSAEPETIHRVYRLLAQRFHPDNQATGDPEQFRLVREAYATLSDKELRAAYDANRVVIFNTEDPRPAADASVTPNDFEFEQAARLTVLEALYTQRRANPNHAGMYDRELADRLGISQDNLEFTIWFLKEKGLVRRSMENSLLTITAEGVEYLEHQNRSGRRRLPAQRAT